MARIAVDMDHVLADAHGGQLDWLEATYSIRPHMEPGQKFRDVITGDQNLALKKMLEFGDFFSDLSPLPGAVRTIQKLLEDHEIFIATAAMMYPNSFSPKYEWIKTHLPFFDAFNIVYCGGKSIIAADYLIDDHSFNFDNFAGQGILFSALHNQNDAWAPRVENWDEIANYNF